MFSHLTDAKAKNILVKTLITHLGKQEEQGQRQDIGCSIKTGQSKLRNLVVLKGFLSKRCFSCLPPSVNLFRKFTEGK